MSLDIHLAIDTGGPETATVEDVGNHTSNTSGMWADALDCPLRDLHGRKAGDCCDLLQRGVSRMDNDPARYKAMNPTNGWGDYNSARDFLQKLLTACRRHPLATIVIY